MKVAITGAGTVSSLGNSTDEMFARVLRNETAVKVFPEWRAYRGLNTFVGAPAAPFDISNIPRSARRSMSRMSEMAVVSTVQALASAKLSLEQSFRNCLIFGSTTGSPFAMESHFKKFFERGGPEGQLSTSFFKVMNHSVASNVAVALDYLGPQLGISSACSTSSQAMVLGWELIHSGLYDVVVAGGADELHHMSAGVFDVVEAASRGFNDRPDETPRPFDIRRDGLVVSEGASTVILESEAHASKRNAPILGWLLGGAYVCDGSHMSQPRQPSMVSTMRLALERANVRPDSIGYISAHATGTRLGDVEETRAIGELFGASVPVSSLKGHFGHSMAACGGTEAILTLEMARRGVLLPTRNLSEVDPECGDVRVFNSPMEYRTDICLSNNFAFGGMNTALVLSL
jgi:3-oxoacyl-[acyl-carrier-protein] synthase II